MRIAPAATAGRRSLLARSVWLAVLALTLAIFAASLPAYLAQLQTPCVGACEYPEFEQLTPSQVAALAGMGLSLEGYAALTVALLLAGMAVCWGVSALIVWRRPDERMALLVALLLVALGPLGVVVSLPTGPTPWQQPYTYLIFLVKALLALVFLLFPGGRFSPRWTRWALVVLLAAQVPVTFLPPVWLLPDGPSGQLGWLVDPFPELALVAGVQLYRYHWVSTPLERQQTKWVVVGLAIPITVSLGMTVLALGVPALAASSAAFVLAFNESVFLFSLCLPLAFGFAVLRYRLWDIDTIIRRTLIYGSLTATLTAVFVGLVIGLQALLGGLLGGIGLIGEDSGVVIVLSTLAILILIVPLRRRLQALIDRRFYRRKYNAEKTLAAFSATLRQEVDPDALGKQVLAVAQETMQPTHASLWLRPSHPLPQRDSGGAPGPP